MKKGHLKFIFFVLILAFIFSECTTRVNVPKEFPDEDSMAVIIADIYYTEAALSQSREYYRGRENDLPKFYKFVLDRHGLTKKEFDTIFSWYSDHPKLLSEVYDKVISILNEKETELKYDTAKTEKKETPRVPGVKDIWKGKRSYSVSIKDSSNNCVPFSIEVDSLENGIFRLIASYKFKKGNLLNKAYMKMIACYSDSTADTVSYSIDKSFTERITTLSLEADKNKYVVELKGLLLEHDTTENAMGTIKDVKLLFIPRPNFPKR